MSSIYVSQSRSNGGAGVEMAGILGLIDDFSATNLYSSTGYQGSTVQNINRGQVSTFNSTILANSSVARILDGNLIQEAFDEINRKASGMKADIIWGEHSTIRAFLESVSNDRRYAGSGNGGMFDAGRAMLSYNGVPLVMDRQAEFNSPIVTGKLILKMHG